MQLVIPSLQMIGAICLSAQYNSADGHFYAMYVQHRSPKTLPFLFYVSFHCLCPPPSPPPNICSSSHCHCPQLSWKTQMLIQWMFISFVLKIPPSRANSTSFASSLHAPSLAVCRCCTRKLSPRQGASIQMYFISMASSCRSNNSAYAAQPKCVTVLDWIDSEETRWTWILKHF